MSRVGIATLAAVIVLLLIANSALFEVGQTQQALLTQFGQPIRVVTKPGLHTKLPLVQTVISFDNRLLDYDMPGEEVILGDQQRLIVDAFARFRITNPLQYFQAVGAQEEGIRARLNSVVSSSLRRVLGNETLPDVLSAQRDRIMRQIRTEVNAEMRGFGISVEDVRIRRADLPPENTAAVLSRMQSERQRIAARARAEGAAAATQIRADADRERTVLLANAKAQADKLRGEGEARAIAIYAAAFQQDPHFFGIWRTLQAYRSAFTAGKAHLVLSPNDAFLNLLRTPPAATAAPGH